MKQTLLPLDSSARLQKPAPNQSVQNEEDYGFLFGIHYERSKDMRKGILFALIAAASIISTSANALPMNGVRIVYFNAAGKVVGLEVQLCKPGGNRTNALQAGTLNSPYYRRDETVCSGSTTQRVCREMGHTTVCDFEVVDVGTGVYSTDVHLPPNMTLSTSNVVYNPGGINYPEIWSVGIETVKADILNSGGTWSDN